MDESSLEASTTMMSKLIRQAHSKMNKDKVKFIPVRAEKFLNIDEAELICDVYIQIKKINQPDQYVKRLHAHYHFSKEEIKKYMSSGLVYFYIPDVNYIDFINMISREIIKSLKNLNYQTLDRFVLNSVAFDTAMERLKNFPQIDEVTIEIVDESLKSMMKSIEKVDSLSQFIKKLKDSGFSFSFLHSYFVALLSEKLAKFFEWNTPQTRDKLVYLSFFHDFSLMNTEWSEINSASELETSDLSDKEKDLVLNHANVSADMLSHFREIPFGLSQLVKEHHGSKSGIGFPDSLSISISPMAMMFVVMEDFATLFIKNNISSAEDLEYVFNQLEGKYTKLSYAQTLDALKGIFLNKKTI